MQWQHGAQRGNTWEAPSVSDGIDDMFVTECDVKFIVDSHISESFICFREALKIFLFRKKSQAESGVRLLGHFLKKTSFPFKLFYSQWRHHLECE